MLRMPKSDKPERECGTCDRWYDRVSFGQVAWGKCNLVSDKLLGSVDQEEYSGPPLDWTVLFPKTFCCKHYYKIPSVTEFLNKGRNRIAKLCMVLSLGALVLVITLKATGVLP